MSHAEPPDDWGENAPSDANEYRTDTYVTAKAAELRSAWIAAVRKHVELQTGESCSYNSKPKWDGGMRYPNGKLSQPVWPKLVIQATEKGLDPLRLVAALFASLGVGQSPQPPELVSDANVARYHRFSSEAVSRAAAAIKTEEVIFRTALWGSGQSRPDPDDAARFALNDMGRALSPLFRYCAARIKGYDDVAGRWRNLAFQQVTEAPEGYLKAWSHILPQDVTDAARAAVGQ